MRNVRAVVVTPLLARGEMRFPRGVTRAAGAEERRHGDGGAVRRQRHQIDLDVLLIERILKGDRRVEGDGELRVDAERCCRRRELAERNVTGLGGDFGFAAAYSAASASRIPAAIGA